MKDELGGKIMTKFFELRAEIYSYLKDNTDEDKKAKTTNKCVIKRKLKFQDCKNRLEATELDSKIDYLEKNKLEIYSIKKNYKEFNKNIDLVLKNRKDLKVKGKMFLLKKLTKLL